jgi:cell division protein FtsX
MTLLMWIGLCIAFLAIVYAAWNYWKLGQTVDSVSFGIHAQEIFLSCFAATAIITIICVILLTA